jgi:predicted ester cyclase
LITAFPDRHITIDNIIAEGNNVVVFTNITGTPQWQLMLAAGILIYGKHIPVNTANLYRIANNKIVEHWI